MEGKLHIYCINLRHRKDRWKRFSEQTEIETLKGSYELERFEGVNGSALNIQKDDRVSLRTKRNIKEHIRRDHEELDSAGGIGCYLSHTNVWKKFLETSDEYAMVLEDDAVIDPGFTAQLQRAMMDTTLLPSIPDVWFLSSSTEQEWYYTYKGLPQPTSVKEYNLGPWTMKVCAFFTGYIISRRGAERLLESAFPIDMHVDMYTCLNGELGRIMTVSHKNINLKQYAFEQVDSDIRAESIGNTNCSICDVPTYYKQKGIVILNVPLLIMSLITLGGIWYVTSKRRR